MTQSELSEVMLGLTSELLHARQTQYPYVTLGHTLLICWHPVSPD